MLMKKKSLIVAAVSSFVISLVLITTLAGYAVYLEMKDDESRKTYCESLHKVNAKVYAKYIEVARLGAAVETDGALKGHPVIEGIVRNRGYRDITDMVLSVKFLDRDGAMLFQTAFHPQEPSLGSSSAAMVTIPYLTGPSKTVIKPESSLPFKRILSACPKEIADELGRPGRPSATGRWQGRLDYEILAVEF